MANDPLPVRVSLRINGMTICASELRGLARKIAGGISVLGPQPPAAHPRREPCLEPELAHELGRQAAGLVLAYPLSVEDQRQPSPGRTQAHVVAGHLVSRLLLGDLSVLRLVVV